MPLSLFCGSFPINVLSTNSTLTQTSDRLRRQTTMSDIDVLAKRVWDYHRMDHELEPSDAILVLCSHDKSVAERGAQLLLDGWASLLIFSGGLGAISNGIWSEPEADQFARIALQMGVP